MSADAGTDDDVAGTDDDVAEAAGTDDDSAEGEGLGRQGWVLVVAVVFAVLVVPLLVYLRPSVSGYHYRTVMLVLPMVPAVVLGLVAVWSMRVGR